MAANHDMVFEPLSLRRRNLVPVSPNQYRVMALSGDARQVEANTAYEAFKLSGLGDVIKIERLSNIDHIIVENSHFIDSGSSDPTVVFSGTMAGQDDPFDSIKRRRNPVVSADELDTLMRALQELAVASPDNTDNVVPADESQIGAPLETITSIGKDVHGDGFDEIIPTAQHPVKPVTVAKPVTLQESQSQPQQMTEMPATSTPTLLPVPEQELSPEEIEKLLGGQ